MRAVLRNLLDDLLSSLWFVPGLMVIGAIGLSVALVEVDRRLLPDLEERVSFVFGGTPDAARDILAVIAGSLITVVAVAFSVTLVVVQQAASQFSPRLLRNFTSDLGNQVVLGTYIATFVYALLVMRQIRVSSDGQDAFVPALALTTGILLAVISLALLVYFIHHTVQSIEVTSIVNHVRNETDGELQRMFPSALGRAPADAPGYREIAELSPDRFGSHETVIESSTAGYLRQVDENGLMDFAEGEVRLVKVSVRVGDYVPRGGQLVVVRSITPLTEEKAAEVEKAFIISVNRTLHQDPLFGIQQIVDIALKALSPGVNDPTTAEQCIAPLGDLMGQLVESEFPSPLRIGRDGAYLLVNRPSFADFMDASFSRIRRSSQGNVHVTCFLLKTLEDIARRTRTDERAKAVRAQVVDVLRSLRDGSLSESEVTAVRESSDSVLAALQFLHEPPNSRPV